MMVLWKVYIFIHFKKWDTLVCFSKLKKKLFAKFIVDCPSESRKKRKRKSVFFPASSEKVISCHGSGVTCKTGLINSELRCRRMWEFVLVLTSTHSKENNTWFRDLNAVIYK